LFFRLLLDDEIDNRYNFRQENSTISKLVQPSDERRSSDNPYESMKRTGENGNHQEAHRQNNNFQYTQRIVPTADVFVDPYRRPAHGNARTCVMEINIAVNFGPDRTPQASVITNNYLSKPPAIRSTATIDDVRYVDLSFQAPEKTAQLATDGIIRHPSSRNSTGFQNKNIDE
jgi:hypothetical protein